MTKPTNWLTSLYDKQRGKDICYELPYGQGFTSEVIRTRKALVINSGVEQRGLELGAVMAAAQELGYPKSWIGVPMLVGDEVIGVISTQDYEKENAFSESDLSLFTAIASNVGIAIKNAQLYAEIQEELAERKKTEADLADSQARLQAIFSNVRAGIGVSREDGKLNFVNDRWEAMFGYTAFELSQKTIWDISHTDEQDSIKDAYRILVNGEMESFQIEKRFINNSGKIFWGSVQSNQRS
jgi:PAS domain S-box-containing protein